MNFMKENKFSVCLKDSIGEVEGSGFGLDVYIVVIKRYSDL